MSFLGDSILSYVVSEYIYTHFTELPEGGLSKLRSAIVCERSLEQIAVSLGIGEYLLLSKGEDMTGGRTRPSILADVIESILAAIYLDGGITPARDFVMRNLGDDIERARMGKKRFSTTIKPAFRSSFSKATAMPRMFIPARRVRSTAKCFSWRFMYPESLRRKARAEVKKRRSKMPQ